MKPQGLSNTVHGFAKVGRREPELFGAVARAAVRFARQAKATAQTATMMHTAVIKSMRQGFTFPRRAPKWLHSNSTGLSFGTKDHLKALLVQILDLDL